MSPRPKAIAKTITVQIPFHLVKRGGRKEMILPPGAEGQPDPATVNSAVVKALARAFRWKRMLESGKFATLGELAASESLEISYLARVLRLTHLAPVIVEAILDGRQQKRLALTQLLGPFASAWADQIRDFNVFAGNDY